MTTANDLLRLIPSISIEPEAKAARRVYVTRAMAGGQDQIPDQSLNSAAARPKDGVYPDSLGI